MVFFTLRRPCAKPRLLGMMTVLLKSTLWLLHFMFLPLRLSTRVKREEGKITSWENLQKAKPDAAIRKLEMKLEKKRRSSLDKIMNKLRSAQKRAEEMGSLMLANRVHQVKKASHKAISLRKTRQMGSLSGCFTCHAY